MYEYLIKKFSRVNCWYLTKLDFVTDDHPPDKFSKKTLYSCTSLQQVFKPELIYVFHELAFGDSSIMDHLKYMYFTYILDIVLMKKLAISGKIANCEINFNNFMKKCMLPQN